MPVVLSPASPIIVTQDEVRRFLRDYPNKNILLDDVQFTQEDVNQALDAVVSAYNVVTPISNITIEAWPAGMKYLLLLGCGWYCMKSEAFAQVRNQATYQDGDIAPIGVDDKFPLYLSFSQSLKQEWDELVKQVKTQLNLESAYGSLGSGYRNVTRYQVA